MNFSLKAWYLINLLMDFNVLDSVAYHCKSIKGILSRWIQFYCMSSHQLNSRVFFIVIIFRSIQLNWKLFFHFHLTNHAVNTKPVNRVRSNVYFPRVRYDIYCWKIIAPIETLWCWLLKALKYMYSSLILFTLECVFPKQMFLFIRFDHMSLHQKCFPLNTRPIRRIVDKPM